MLNITNLSHPTVQALIAKGIRQTVERAKSTGTSSFLFLRSTERKPFLLINYTRQHGLRFIDNTYTGVGMLQCTELVKESLAKFGTLPTNQVA